MALFVKAMAQTQPANRPTLVAGIPVNYQEDYVGTYVLPNLLTCTDGQLVKDARTWTQKRRPELLKLVEEIQFGKMPPRPFDFMSLIGERPLLRARRFANR